MKLGEWIARHRILILLIGMLLLVPSVIGIVKTANRTLFNHAHLPHIAMFMIVGVLTYVLSTITYTWIERPFVRK